MITLKTNDKIFENWITAKVTRSLNAVSGSFEIGYISNFNHDSSEKILLKSGDECSLLYDDQILITGFIDQIDSSCSAETIKLIVKGRDKTGDLVDSANIYTAKHFKSVALKAMAKTLTEPFGISVSSLSNKGDEQIKNVSLQHNETVWETISRVAKYQGVLAYPDKNGGIIFSEISKELVANLDQESEILEINYNQNDSQKFQTYRVYITIGNADSKHKRTVAYAKDHSVKRPRIKQIASNKEITQKEALERARWEMGKHIARSFNLNISVASWLVPETKKLWDINTLISVSFPKFGINGTFLIEETDFNFNENGYKTNLKLVLKDAYNPEIERDSSSIGEIGDI